MNKTELRKEMKMSYNELIAYNHKKYGKPAGSYFLRPTCKSPNSSIKRTAEGLFIHHIKETEIDDLSKTSQALKAPWSYQEPDNLCYCNYLEHLLIHVHINIQRCQQQDCIVIDGLLRYLIPEINEVYRRTEPYTQDWRNQVKNAVVNNYEEYKDILTYWLKQIEPYDFDGITLDELLDL